MTDLLDRPELDTPSPPPRSALRRLLHEYRPAVVTGGASAVPLLVLAGLNAADELDRVAFGLLLPEIRNYFGVSLTTILTVSALAGLLPILLAVPLGFLADRLDRTKMVGAGATMWGVFSILTAFSGNLLFLGFSRFGSGLGKTMDPTYTALLSDYYPPDRRAGVFAVHRLGNEFGMLIAPVTAGLLASVFFWQVPFLVFGIPSLVLAALAFFSLRDPVRGGMERRLLGMSAEDAAIAEAPPGWTESWRIARGVRTLRRVWASLPFLVGSTLGIVGLISEYYREEFGLGEAARGLISSSNNLFGIVGILVGGAFGNRLLARKPSQLVVLGAALAVLPAISFIVIAYSPYLALSIGVGWLNALVLPVLAPTSSALMSLTIPPRARGFAFAAGALFIAPGLLILPLIGVIADTYGIRNGILMLVPVFLIGAAILGSSAASVEGDIRAATAAAAATQAGRRRGGDDVENLLVCRDVDVHYGSVQILFNVDFDVERGEIVALLGTNGAGKSTLLNAISGTVTPSNGAVSFDGEDITFLPASEHVERGVVVVPGGRAVFPSLTVRENLELATWPLDDRTVADSRIDEVYELFPRLRERHDENAGSLSGGEQQMLALGQALVIRPKLLMIDELSLGLAPAVVGQLLDVVREVRRRGTTVILVEQSVNVALEIADRAVFMEKGEVRFTGSTEELMHRGDILRSVFLAGSGAGPARRTSRASAADAPAEVILAVADVSVAFGGVRALHRASLELRADEILGIIGPNGAGKTTLFDVISGFVVPDEGTIRLLGEDISAMGPDRRAMSGIQRCFQDAALFPALTVEDNVLVALDRHLSVRNAAFAGMRLPQVRHAEARLRKRAERLLGTLNLEPFRDKFVGELSTGSRRLVDLACVLGTDPTVLLLDEPSSGVAQRESEELGPLIRRIQNETRCAVLLIEHDMPLISSVSDELLAMELGTHVTRGEPAAVLADERVVRAYLGSSVSAINRSGDLA